jgi:hypothetical protein
MNGGISEEAMEGIIVRGSGRVRGSQLVKICQAQLATTWRPPPFPPFHR